jgi:hypothetical protein
MKKKRAKTKVSSADALSKRLDESVLEIDVHRLDAECIAQPRLYHKYATELAKAKNRLDEAENRLKTIKALLDNLIRTDPSKFDLPEKLTETLIANTVIIQEKYKKAQAKVTDCQYLVSLLYAMVIALDHKKNSLENLIKLHGQDYFSAPRTDEKTAEKLREHRSKAVAKRCTKTKRK